MDQTSTDSGSLDNTVSAFSDMFAQVKGIAQAINQAKKTSPTAQQVIAASTPAPTQSASAQPATGMFSNPYVKWGLIAAAVIGAVVIAKKVL